MIYKAPIIKYRKTKANYSNTTLPTFKEILHPCDNCSIKLEFGHNEYIDSANIALIIPAISKWVIRRKSDPACACQVSFFSMFVAEIFCQLIFLSHRGILCSCMP